MQEDSWKRAVEEICLENGLVVDETMSAEENVRKLIEWIVKQAVDFRISKEAFNLAKDWYFEGYSKATCVLFGESVDELFLERVQQRKNK